METVNNIVVGFMGKAGVGKDTAGDYLVRRYGFKKDTFAAPLKRLVSDIFNIPDDILNPIDEESRRLREAPVVGWPEHTPRELLQFIGTELFRNQLDRDIWVKSLCHRIRKSSCKRYVLTDIRFPNEKEALSKEFGNDFISVKITRNGYSGDTHGGIKAHESESYDIPCQYCLSNDGTFEELFSSIDEIIRKEGN